MAAEMASIKIPTGQMVVTIQPQMEAYFKERIPVVCQIQKASEAPSSTIQNFPDPCQETLQACETRRKTIFLESR